MLGGGCGCSLCAPAAGFQSSGADEFAYNGAGSTVTANSSSSNRLANGLLANNNWNSPITYSNPDAAGDYGAYNNDGDGDGISSQNEGFSQFSAVQIRAAHFALSQDIVTQPAGAAGFAVEAFTDLATSFAGAGSGAGTIRLANSSDAAPTAYAFYPSNSVFGGDGWFSSAGSNPVVGNYHWATVIHEIGHALGLKHGHETEFGFPTLPSANDSLEYSVMTYRSYVGGPTSGAFTNETFGYPQTWMMADIAALQHMSGPISPATAATPPTAGARPPANPSSTAPKRFNPGDNRIFMTIWDGDGNDTYDASNYTTNLAIDLRPGEYSVLSAAQLADLSAF